MVLTKTQLAEANQKAAEINKNLAHLPDNIRAFRILEAYKGASPEQLSELGLSQTSTPQAPTPIASKKIVEKLTAKDFAKPVNDIKGGIRSLAPQGIIEGNFLSLAANEGNPEAVTKLLQQFIQPPEGALTLSEDQKQKALEVGFLELLKSAHSIRTKYSSQLEVAREKKNAIEAENSRIDVLETIEGINDKIVELKLDRQELDEKIKEIGQRRLLGGQKRKLIKEESIKFIKNSREEITTEAEQEYLRLERLNIKAHKNLGDAIGKYGTVGVNFESTNIIEALNEQTGVLKGGLAKKIDTRRAVKKFITSAKDLQKTFASKSNSSTKKIEKTTILSDLSPELSDDLKKSVENYTNATKENKEIKKTAMKQVLLFELGYRSARLQLLKDKLPEGVLKDNMDSYIKEANEYQIYKALGLKEDENPPMTMEMDKRLITEELKQLVNEEIPLVEARDISQAEAENEVKDILQEIGVSSNVTGLADKVQGEEIDRKSALDIANKDKSINQAETSQTQPAHEEGDKLFSALKNFMLNVDAERKNNSKFLEEQSPDSEKKGKLDSMMLKFKTESGLEDKQMQKTRPMLIEAAKKIPQAGFKAWLTELENKIRKSLGMELKEVKSQDKRIEQYVEKKLVENLRKALNPDDFFEKNNSSSIKKIMSKNKGRSQ
ncbi:MAG: hypothetical protein N4A31_07140 [Rickettsiales bacterium]|jgi:hypothetical protein|nr:hypothetical protein [Rickettsiales bacterium]